MSWEGRPDGGLEIGGMACMGRMGSACRVRGGSRDALGRQLRRLAVEPARTFPYEGWLRHARLATVSLVLGCSFTRCTHVLLASVPLSQSRLCSSF